MFKAIKDYTIGGVCAFLVILALYMAFFSGPKTVKIDEKHFHCTAAESHGIEARCTQYTSHSVK